MTADHIERVENRRTGRRFAADFYAIELAGGARYRVRPLALSREEVDRGDREGLAVRRDARRDRRGTRAVQEPRHARDLQHGDLRSRAGRHAAEVALARPIKNLVAGP